MTDILTWDEDTYKEGTYGKLIWDFYVKGLDLLCNVVYTHMKNNNKKFEDKI